jgi:tetratricopeptide (TPR) repeat protein
MHGYWNGNYPGNYLWNRNYFGGPGWYGPYGYGGWGGYGPFGYGLGALGLGLGLGYGLGGFGYGLGGLGYGGWGYPGYGYGGYGLGGYGLGLGNGGWGLSSWAYGPMVYDWGYSTYSNPYYDSSAATAPQSIVYDYSQPINPTTAAPEETAAEQALSQFENARVAFKNGDYAGALDLTDQALRQMPNDPALHEFRALVLFAFQRYPEAATSLFAVLSVGPGWDWTTMIGLYPSVEAYTSQLRALEGYAGQNPQSAPARFVLAYHYMTQGHIQAAVGELEQVVSLQPRDTLSRHLLSQLQRVDQAAAPSGTVASQPASPTTPASPTSGTSGAPAAPAGNLTGTWTAQPDPGTTINLSVADGHHFTWKVTRQNRAQEFQGDATFNNGILTLVPTGHDNEPPMTGRVTWKDDKHFTFKLLGSGPDDPGLTFTRSA